MNRFQMEKIYESNGLSDYRLNELTDISKIHGYDVTAIKGYNTLSELHKKVFNSFIVNFFNGFGFEARMTIEPKGIYYVEELEQVAQDPIYDDCVTPIKNTVKSIDLNGKKKVLHTWQDKENANLPVVNEYRKQYLRFELMFGAGRRRRKEWYHVESEKSWY